MTTRGRTTIGITVGVVLALAAPLLAAIGELSGNVSLLSGNLGLLSGNESVTAFAHLAAHRGADGYVGGIMNGGSFGLWVSAQQGAEADVGIKTSDASYHTRQGSAWAWLDVCDPSCRTYSFQGPADGFTQQPTLRRAWFSATLTDEDGEECNVLATWSGGSLETGHYEFSYGDNRSQRASGQVDIFRFADVSLLSNCLREPSTRYSAGVVFANARARGHAQQHVLPPVPA